MRLVFDFPLELRLSQEQTPQGSCWLVFDVGKESADCPISVHTARVWQIVAGEEERGQPQKVNRPWPLCFVSPGALSHAGLHAHSAHLPSGSGAVAGFGPFSNICFETRCLQVSHSQGIEGRRPRQAAAAQAPGSCTGPRADENLEPLWIPRKDQPVVGPGTSRDSQALGGNRQDPLPKVPVQAQKSPQGETPLT